MWGVCGWWDQEEGGLLIHSGNIALNSGVQTSVKADRGGQGSVEAHRRCFPLWCGVSVSPSVRFPHLSRAVCASSASVLYVSAGGLPAPPGSVGTHFTFTTEAGWRRRGGVGLPGAGALQELPLGALPCILAFTALAPFLRLHVFLSEWFPSQPRGAGVVFGDRPESVSPAAGSACTWLCGNDAEQATGMHSMCVCVTRSCLPAHVILQDIPGGP